MHLKSKRIVVENIISQHCKLYIVNCASWRKHEASRCTRWLKSYSALVKSHLKPSCHNRCWKADSWPPKIHAHYLTPFNQALKKAKATDQKLECTTRSFSFHSVMHISTIWHSTDRTGWQSQYHRLLYEFKLRDQPFRIYVCYHLLTQANTLQTSGFTLQPSRSASHHTPIEHEVRG